MKSSAKAGSASLLVAIVSGFRWLPVSIAAENCRRQGCCERNAYHKYTCFGTKFESYSPVWTETCDICKDDTAANQTKPSRVFKMDFLPTKFVLQPSEALKCPICRRLFCDPVISTVCGHTFCKECITANSPGNGLLSTSKCPIDDSLLQRTQLVVNLALKGQLEDLLIYCRHALTRSDSEEEFEVDENGCSQHITLGKRKEHEDVCGYAIVPCPNSSNQCGKFRRRDLEDHLKICPQYKCDFHRKGCEFTGTKENVEKHIKVCNCRNGKEARGDFHEEGQQLQFLQQSNGELKMTVMVLSERVTWIEKNQESMVSQIEQCNSAITSLTETVEDLSYQVEQLTKIIKRSSMYREMSVTSIPETVSSNSPEDNNLSRSQHRTSHKYRSGHILVPSHDEVWNLPCIFKCMGTLRGHHGTIWSMVSKGHRLYSAGGDRVVKVWNMENVRLARCISTLEGHTSDIHAMTAGGGKLYTAGSDMTIIAWNIENLTENIRVEKAHENIICAIVYSGKYVFTSSHSTIKVWDAASLSEVHCMSGLHHWVRALALDEKRERVFSGSHNTIHVWETSGGFAQQDKIEHSFGSVYSLAINKEFVIAGTYNQNIHIYDLHSYQHLKQLVGHLGTVTGLAISNAGKLLFSASYDNTVQVWNLETMLPYQTLSRHEASVNCVVIHKDLLLSGSEDTEIKVFKYFKLE